MGLAHCLCISRAEMQRMYSQACESRSPEGSEKRGWLPSCLTRRSYSHPLQVCRTLSSGHICRQRLSRQTAVGKIAFRLCFRCEFEEQTLPANSFEILAHTLDLTANGARLGSIRHQLKVLDTLTIFYRQRRMEFTVVWTKLLDGRSEYQVGLQAFSQEKEGWGMNLFISAIQPLTAPQRRRERCEPENIMRNLLIKLWSNDEGQDVAEYAVMLAVVLVIVASTVRLIGANASNVFSQVGSTIQ